MDWLKRLGGFLGGVGNQAQRTIGGIGGGANQAFQQAQRAFRPVAQQVQRNIPRPPVIPRIQVPVIPKIQLPPIPQFRPPAIPQFRPPALPQAPKIDFNAVNQALSNYYGRTALSKTPENLQNIGRVVSPVVRSFSGATGEGLNTLRSAPAAANVLTAAQIEILGKAIGNKSIENKANLARQKAFAEYTRQSQTGINPVGSAQQIAIDKGGLSGLGAFTKAFGTKGLKAGLEIAPAVTGLPAGASVLSTLGKGGTLGAGGNVLYSGLSGSYKNKSAKDLALQAAADVGMGYGGELAGIGLNKVIGKAGSALLAQKGLTPQLPSMYGKAAIGQDVPASYLKPKAPQAGGAPLGQKGLTPQLPKIDVTSPEALALKPKNVAISKLKSIAGDRELALQDYNAGRYSMTDLPVLVKIEKNGSLTVLDGNGRIIAAQQAGQTNIPITTNEKLYREILDAREKLPSMYGKGTIGQDVPASFLQPKAPQVGKTDLPSMYGKGQIGSDVPESYLQPKAPKVPIKAAVTDQIAPGDIKISSAIDSKKPGLKVRGQEIREQFANRFAPVEDLVSKIEKQSGTALRPSKNPLSYVRQYLGGGGIANSKIDNQLTPIIKQTKQFDGLREYLVAKRMNELADRGMSKRADNVLDGINKKYGAEVGNFDKIAKELYAYQNKQIDDLVSVGVLTREAADNIRAKNQFYVPFNRVIPELEDFAGTTPGQAIGRNANPIKAIHGSDKDIIDPIESMIRNTYDIQATVQKQKVMRSLYELAPDEFAIPAKNSMNKNRVGMFIDGQKTMLETSEPLARSLNSMAEEQMNFAVRVMSLPARALRSGATSLNVAFALPNIVRDQLSAAVNSKYGGVPIYDFVAGLASVIKKDDSYKRWITSGADQASFFAQDRTTLQRGVKDITGGLGYKAGRLVKSPLELFRVIGEFSEKGSRVGVYKRAERGAMKQFGNAEEAALAAAKESREATIDFARRGSKMKAANSLVPFLNARLQGTLKLANSFKERPVQTGAIGMAIAGLPAAALYLHNSEYPEYAEIPDYLKRENFIIMTGNKETPFIKIPKGEVGKIFGNPVESFLAQLKSDDPSWKSTVASMVDSFLPVGSVEDPGKFVTDLMPTAASVPLQLTANFDTFRGMPIVSQYQKDLPAEQQFTKYNTETGKKIGAALGISPAKLEFGIGGFTGGLGRQALQLADIATGNKVAIQDLPVISRFAGEQKDLSKSASKVYEDADKAKVAKARENFAIKKALEKGDTSVLEGLDKTTATRLKRTVAENQAKDKLTPIQKALFGLPKDQLQSIKDSGQYQDDINFVEKVKDSLSAKKPTSGGDTIKAGQLGYETKQPKVKISKPKKVSKGRKGRAPAKGRAAGRGRATSFKLPKIKTVSTRKAPASPKAPKVGRVKGFAKLRPTKSARKTIKIKTG
jgi:hypothetical protein